MAYKQKLKDPKWLLKRGKVLKRDNNRCTVCGSMFRLQVHHTFYHNDGRPPWDYPLESLLTLCSGCHNKYHEQHELTIIKKEKKAKKVKTQKPQVIVKETKYKHYRGEYYKQVTRTIGGKKVTVWRKK